MKKSRLREIIKEIILKESRGRGFFNLKKGKKIKSPKELKVGEIILGHSKQFNADNTYKVVKFRKLPNGDIWTDLIYWDPITNKKMGPENMPVRPREFAGTDDEYFKAIK